MSAVDLMEFYVQKGSTGVYNLYLNKGRTILRQWLLNDDGDLVDFAERRLTEVLQTSAAGERVEFRAEGVPKWLKDPMGILVYSYNRKRNQS